MLSRDTWQEILTTISRNKLRTTLTAFGVFWGIFMLLILLGFGQALQRGATQNMRGIALNTVYIWGQRTTLPYQGMQPGRYIGFKTADYPALADLPGVQYVAPRIQLGGWRGDNLIKRGHRSGSFEVMGDYPQVRQTQPIDMAEGRFLSPLDIEERRKVAVIGEQVYKELYAPGEPVVGSYIEVNGVYFQVIGLFQSLRTGEDADRDTRTIHVPFTSFQQAFNTGDRIAFFAIGAAADHSAAEVEKDVKAVLRARHKVHPDDERAVGGFNAAEEFGKMQALFFGIRIFFWFVGVATLLTGVLGVSNIMLIAVKERTREIGLRKALGATPRSIVGMILQESIVLTAMAGYLGLVAGVGLIELVASLFPDGLGALGRPEVDFEVAVAATLVLIVAGAIAGIIPARHAARVNPVSALRSE